MAKHGATISMKDDLDTLHDQTPHQDQPGRGQIEK